MYIVQWSRFGLATLMWGELVNALPSKDDEHFPHYFTLLIYMHWAVWYDMTHHLPTCDARVWGVDETLGIDNWYTMKQRLFPQVIVYKRWDNANLRQTKPDENQFWSILHKQCDHITPFVSNALKIIRNFVGKTLNFFKGPLLVFKHEGNFFLCFLAVSWKISHTFQLFFFTFFTFFSAPTASSINLKSPVIYR